MVLFQICKYLQDYYKMMQKYIFFNMMYNIVENKTTMDYNMLSLINFSQNIPRYAKT